MMFKQSINIHKYVKCITQALLVCIFMIELFVGGAIDASNSYNFPNKNEILLRLKL